MKTKKTSQVKETVLGCVKKKLCTSDNKSEGNIGHRKGRVCSKEEKRRPARERWLVRLLGQSGLLGQARGREARHRRRATLARRLVLALHTDSCEIAWAQFQAIKYHNQPHYVAFCANKPGSTQPSKTQLEPRRRRTDCHRLDSPLPTQCLGRARPSECSMCHD